MSKGFKVFLLIAGVVSAVIAVEFDVGTSTQRMSTQAAAPAPTAPVSTAEQRLRAAKCDKTLKTDRSGIWRHYQVDGQIMTVEIGPKFDLADFDTKRALAALMVCEATQGRMDKSVDFVDFLDWRTHQSVATWSRTGFTSQANGRRIAPPSAVRVNR